MSKRLEFTGWIDRDIFDPGDRIHFSQAEGELYYYIPEDSTDSPVVARRITLEDPSEPSLVKRIKVEIVECQIAAVSNGAQDACDRFDYLLKRIEEMERGE